MFLLLDFYLVLFPSRYFLFLLVSDLVSVVDVTSLFQDSVSADCVLLRSVEWHPKVIKNFV